ncbi:hypothetical protein IB75_10715 [Nitrosococcus oceani C-27]|uniref:Uncharacterized protein n=1 Tax=Nitrosococcus oceani C-27 TaxID=314279 RepID=A0A0E2Z0B1_9GAMM|nr:hypothetical protein IB75_10715 [Nitrosococcus oceani C-27]
MDNRDLDSLNFITEALPFRAERKRQPNGYAVKLGKPLLIPNIACFDLIGIEGVQLQASSFRERSLTQGKHQLGSQF